MRITIAQAFLSVLVFCDWSKTKRKVAVIRGLSEDENDSQEVHYLEQRHKLYSFTVYI